MSPEFALTLAQEALTVALLVGAPILGLGLAVGLVVALFQATTQINESSLQFLPKVLASMVGVIIFGGWMTTTLVDFTRRLFLMLPTLVQ